MFQRSSTNLVKSKSKHFLKSNSHNGYEVFKLSNPVLSNPILGKNKYLDTFYSRRNKQSFGLHLLIWLVDLERLGSTWIWLGYASNFLNNNCCS